MKKFKIPIKKYEKYECYFRVYESNDSGDINITLRMNTINDRQTYKWIYANVNEVANVDSKEFFKALMELYDELQHLSFAWEGQEDKYANGKYIKGSILYAIPIFDGKDNIKQIVEDYPFPAMHYIKSL